MVDTSKLFEEIDFLAGENCGKIRITNIEKGWTEGRCIRIQIVQENGQLHKGPEIPIETIPAFVQALTKVLIQEQ